MRVVVSTAAAEVAAEQMASWLAAAVKARRTASLALSGGSTGPPLIEALVADSRVDWNRVSVHQVDERIAPDGDAARNAIQLAPLAAVGATVRQMPVTADDLRAAARRYARTLPERFDVVHLGAGDDGHTASWPPPPHPDAGVATSARAIELVGEFNGWPRMTMTQHVVDGARNRAVLVTGEAKADVVAGWLGDDRGVTEPATAPGVSAPHPIEIVRRTATVVFLDPGAASRLSM